MSARTDLRPPLVVKSMVDKKGIYYCKYSCATSFALTSHKISTILNIILSSTCRVLEHANENRMRSQNIAIVLGPTLMWPEKESSAIAVNMMCQNSIVEYILSAFDRLF